MKFNGRGIKQKKYVLFSPLTIKAIIFVIIEKIHTINKPFDGKPTRC